VLDSPQDLGAVIGSLVRPYLIADRDPRQTELLQAIDSALAEGMRSILHDPTFQAAEALWRGVHLLVARLETGSSLQIHLLDATDAELALALANGAWSPGEATLIVVLRAFSGADSEIAMLRDLARLGQRAGAACLTSGVPALIGAAGAEALAEPHDWQGPPEGWTALRQEDSAPYLGVAIPRFLLRMPYGEEGEECELFRFEELGDESAEGDYLWGNPALACALLLAQSITGQGRGMHPGAHHELDGLPLPLVRRNGEPTVRHPAEVPLSPDAAEQLLERGVMPLAPVPDRNAVRVLRFQSVAEPPAPLAGRWSSSRT
jgi:type VI secretion system protein ImpC